VRVLSNDAGVIRNSPRRDTPGAGFDVAPEEIVFGLDLLAPTLTELGVSPEDCVLVAPRPAPRAAVTAPMLDLYDPRAMDAAAIAFLSTVGYTEATDARLRALLRHKPRPMLVCNPDIVSPEPEGIAIEPGFYAHRLAADLGCAPTFLGKPFPGVYAAVLRRCRVYRPTASCVSATHRIRTCSAAPWPAWIRCWWRAGFSGGGGVTATRSARCARRRGWRPPGGRRISRECLAGLTAGGR
jgi:ribonucleotide monophosphatase NagD (HAD superfamily)